MTRIELKNAAKEQIQGKIGLLFVMFLIVAIIGAGCSLVPVIGWFATIIIMPAFEISLCMIYLALTKNEEVSVGDVFKGFNITGKAVWLSIITEIFTFLWSLLLIIPGIVKAFSYAMAVHSMIDYIEDKKTAGMCDDDEKIIEDFIEEFVRIYGTE